ncbi:M3 family metallopeptidase [Legionella sp. 16cNR16C]|uniref:M3 family metallopeptidase n=1 Tax=Legionella sp. 16cNR16C TaxID=2905656 RepID=UPI001E30FA9F|nr:M3 family metallopeptidase [Legionella sp. 16cNR16C]MCE3045194.1 M3 family metallopeptidase [Legionella sp. 16cNR16C]
MSKVKLPSFKSIDPEHFANDLGDMLQNNLERINTLLQQETAFTWENLIEPLDEMEDELERFWSPLSHLHAVVNSPELRACYKDCLPKLSAYQSAIGQNQALYEAVRSLDVTHMDDVQKKLHEDMLQGFELSGVALSPEDKQEFENIQARVSELSNQFENNVLDAGQAFTMHVTDEAKLKGLPEHAILTAKELAEEKQLPGWVLNLEFPCYLAVITYADDRELRETFYHAFVTRASDQGPTAGKFDNSAIMQEILALRHREAQLLGFKNYAELSIATKMVDSTTQVTDFLLDLSERALDQARAEFQNLQKYAREEWKIDPVSPWDIPYLSEKLSHRDYNFSQEELRPFFPQNQVMNGLFNIIERLYGIRLQEVKNAETWHPDVICYELLDEKNDSRGFMYVDLYARQNKRGGAWMDSLQTRRRLPNGEIQLPIATLTCNFAKPAGDNPGTLSHDEVSTLFHECGHCLHHLLTQVDYLSASGIHGVEWDAVELPSQIFENWCWEKEALDELSCHVVTGEKLSDQWYEKMLAAKNFQSAMGMMRQLEFSLFDFRIHQHFANEADFVARMLKEVRSITAVTPSTPYNRFPHSFTHIFAGGYAAGYYSYKWAEVLSSDAYSRFEEEGIFNPKTGRDFLRSILEVGGSKKAADAFISFRGRPATVDALLRHNGIKS